MAKDNKSHQVKTSEGNVESVKTKEKEPVVEKMRVEDSKKEDKMPTSKKESKPNEPVKPFKTSFEKWIESSLLDPQAKEDSGSTINLGREGLKNASQVKKFLLSPAGKDVMAELGAQMALQRNINLQNQQDRMEHELFKRRLMAALFLWYLSKKSHAAEKVKETIREYNEKAIKNAEKASKSTQQSTSSTSQADKEFQKMLDEYEQAIKRAQEHIKKGEELEKNWISWNVKAKILKTNTIPMKKTWKGLKNFSLILKSYHYPKLKKKWKHSTKTVRNSRN